ncbi:phosphatase PAP2 family protein [Planococcus sp. ISL-110]|uniref:phosphatase PAP2 family protein n=1 Tax=Planococcus sp. ISL-110 TaxID=2819167 RepID=UPI001BEB0D0C|nr:phosphatase PAP2 family protein [Planococcus sp. ISL-110]MBT2571136.1 phosphatase PAP2 family protein [Planococcus sp. ISL-110]
MEEENRKIGFIALLLIIGLGISSLFIWLFAELAEELMENELRFFDNVIISFFKVIETSTLDTIYIIITEFGSVWFLATMSVVIILLLWFKAKDKWGILFFAIAVGGSGLLTWLLKQVYERGRPSINEEVDAIGFSFPSGHSMGSLIFYGFIVYFILRSSQNKVIKLTSFIGLGILIILIGTSRIYLGVHFPSDVLAGYIAGTIWLILCLLALEWIQWQSNSQVRPVNALRRILVSSFKSGRQKLGR